MQVFLKYLIIYLNIICALINIEIINYIVMLIPSLIKQK